MNVFHGLMVATLTPFDTSDRLDPGVIRAHSQFLIEGGAIGLCPAGTTGEMLVLSIDEKVRLIEETCRGVEGRVPVIAGIWSHRERDVAVLGRAAKDAGAAAVFLPTPIYYPASDDVIYRWYEHASVVSGLPVFAYNIPSYASNNISLDCLERLVADGIIVGIKDSTGTSEQMTALVGRFGDRVAVEAASDAFVSEARSIGAHGFISALANVWPSALRKIWDGEDTLQQPLAAMRDVVKRTGGISAIKYMASKHGFAFGESRLPFSALGYEEIRRLDAAFEVAARSGLV